MKKENKEENRVDIRTDLAIEAREMLAKDEAENIEIEGVKMTIEQNEYESIHVTSVEILNEAGSRNMGKPVGKYITIESAAMKENDTESHEEIIRILSKRLGEMHNLNKESTVLVVGLGNWRVTPDALGPKVVSKILVTRHILGTGNVPIEIEGSVRVASAISPGVMGLTGIETAEIVRGIVERIKPDLIIAVDALAARKTSRINATIQMSNTGISPGGGMGNKRMSLDHETMGVPVIAIGVPTVVDAATLVNDTMDMMLGSMISESERGSEFYEMLSSLQSEEKYRLIKEVLNPYAGNMFVTPKEVDAVVDRLTNIIANSINIAIHEGISTDDINRYLNQ